MRKRRTKRYERTLALDVSSACTGWVLFRGKKYYKYGKHIPKGAGHGQKMTDFRAWLLTILKKYDPDNIVVEMPWPGRNRNAFRVLTMYVGIVEQLHYEHLGIEIPDDHKFPPMKIKKVMAVAAGKTHEARKRNMVRKINELYGLNLKFSKKKSATEDDIADAFAVGTTWLILHRNWMH